LAGSPKQVAAAHPLRAARLATIADKYLHTHAASIRDAGFWIDTKAVSPKDFPVRVQRALARQRYIDGADKHYSGLLKGWHRTKQVEAHLHALARAELLKAIPIPRKVQQIQNLYRVASSLNKQELAMRVAVDLAINTAINQVLKEIPVAAPFVVAAEAVKMAVGPINELALSDFEREHQERAERQQNPLTYSQIRDIRHQIGR